MLTSIKTIGKKSLVIIPLLFIVGFSVSYMAGCSSTPARITYATSATVRVTTQEALKFWNDQFVKTGKSTVAQETAVKNTYDKVRAAGILLADAGKAMSAATASGGTPTQEMVAAFEQATSDFANDKADFVSLLTQFGVKF